MASSCGKAVRKKMGGNKFDIKRANRANHGSMYAKKRSRWQKQEVARGPKG